MTPSLQGLSTGHRIDKPSLWKFFNCEGGVGWAVAGPLLGIISAAYNLGAILAVPIVSVGSTSPTEALVGAC